MTNNELIKKINEEKSKALKKDLNTSMQMDIVANIIKLRRQLAFQNICFSGNENINLVVEDSINFFIFLEEILTREIDDREFDALLRVILKECELANAIDVKNKMIKQIKITIKNVKLKLMESESNKEKIKNLNYLLELVDNYTLPVVNKREGSNQQK